MKPSQSIFAEYYSDREFIDLYSLCPQDAVDVLIPIIHTNELWRANLLSIYREIPVNRLIISDGGCKDDSLEIARQFPRTLVLDHHEHKSLGFCLRKLVEEVETEWFLYLHSDVYLPADWFKTMKNHCGQYEWFGCRQQITSLVEFPNVDKMAGNVRPHAGAQMGRKDVFSGMSTVDDDYVYRQEDLILASLVEKAGGRVGNLDNLYHYHQVMHKDSPWARKITSVSTQVEWSDVEKIRAATMQIRGIIKYLAPSDYLVIEVINNILVLRDTTDFDWKEFKQWIAQTNPMWNQRISRSQIERLRRFRTLYPRIKKLLLRR